MASSAWLTCESEMTLIYCINKVFDRISPFEGEHREPLFRVLEMFHDLVPLHGHLVFRLLLEVIELDDVLGDIAQLVVREDIIDQGNMPVFHVVGEIPQLGDGLSDTIGDKTKKNNRLINRKK